MSADVHHYELHVMACTENGFPIGSAGCMFSRHLIDDKPAFQTWAPMQVERMVDQCDDQVRAREEGR